MKQIAIAAGLVALLAAGCSSVTAEPAADAVEGTNRPATSAPAAPDPAPTEPETSEPVDDGTAPFGSTYTWTDGLSVTIGEAQPYTPSEWAAADEADHYVVFDVHVINNTGAPWDPFLFHATIQSANQEGSSVYDSEQLPPEPSTKLLDGREAQFQIAYGVVDPADLVLEVSPDWDHESVIFHG